MFHFRWEESTPAPPPAAPTANSDSCCSIGSRPEALGGTSKRYFTDVSYVYELTAPDGVGRG